MLAPLAPKSDEIKSTVARTQLANATRVKAAGAAQHREGLPLFLKARLSVGLPHDAYEGEADRAADHVMSAVQPRVQRSCGCAGDCPKCSVQAVSDVKLSRLAANGGIHGAAPDIVHEVVNSPGSPLQAATRAYMEPRFGREFSGVRLHTDTRAAASARAVCAMAYTVGRNIVFDTGRLNPDTPQGSYVLAHELAHVVQQGHERTQVQRWDTCYAPRMILDEGQGNCPPREPEEMQRARTGPMVFVNVRDPDTGTRGELIANFDIGSDEIKPSLRRTANWNQFLKTIAANKSKWRLVGFTDCEGKDAKNDGLRASRAKAVYNILPKAVKAQITSYSGEPIVSCVTDNYNAGDRALNRSVALMPEDATADFEEEVIDVTLPTNEPANEDCSQEQRDHLAIAYPLAETMIETAMSAIGRMKPGTDQEKLLVKYFGKDAYAHRFRIKRGFVDTLRQWRKGPHYPYVCMKQGAGECSPGTFGYVESFGLPGWAWGPKGEIQICQDAFNMKNDVKLATVLVHETSHRLDWTTGDVYRGMDTNEGCTLATVKAEGNADSYAQFARECYEKGY